MYFNKYNIISDEKHWSNLSQCRIPDMKKPLPLSKCCNVYTKIWCTIYFKYIRWQILTPLLIYYCPFESATSTKWCYLFHFIMSAFACCSFLGFFPLLCAFACVLYETFWVWSLLYNTFHLQKNSLFKNWTS